MSSYSLAVSASASLFVRRTFTPLVPRGVRARIIRGELNLAYDTIHNLSASSSIFAALSKRTDLPAANPSSARVVNSLKLVMPLIVNQTVLGTPADEVKHRETARVIRDFRNEPHRTAEILNIGTRSNETAGWSILLWTQTNTSTAIIWGSLEVELEWIDGSGNPKPLARQQRFQVMNQ